MNLDAQRRRRQIVRQMLINRSNALANTTQRGAASDGGSTLPGLYGQVSQQANNEIAGVEANRQLGSQVFQANRQIASGQTQGSVGQAITSVGGTILQNKGEITSVGQQIGAMF